MATITVAVAMGTPDFAILALCSCVADAGPRRGPGVTFLENPLHGRAGHLPRQGLGVEPAGAGREQRSARRARLVVRGGGGRKPANRGAAIAYEGLDERVVDKHTQREARISGVGAAAPCVGH